MAPECQVPVCCSRLLLGPPVTSRFSCYSSVLLVTSRFSPYSAYFSVLHIPSRSSRYFSVLLRGETTPPSLTDSILKYVIVGDSAVGKSSLLVRLTDDRFAATEPTLGVEFGSRILDVGDEGRRVKVQCWDTAGTESFRSITRSYFRGAAGALLVYDVTRRDSFEHVTSWLNDLKAHADEQVAIILVANKTDLCYATPPPLPDIQYGQAVPTPAPSDLTDSASPSSSPPSALKDPSLKPRAVSTLEGAIFAKQHGLLYVETSAKEGWGVVDAFEWTAREVLQRLQTSENALARRSEIG